MRDIFNFLWDQDAQCSFGKKKTFVLSQLTIEVLEQGMKYVQSQEERSQNNVNDVVWSLIY